MKVLQSGFNLNWIEFDYTGNSMGISDDVISNFKLFPNPTVDFVNINTQLDNFKVEIFDLLGKNIFKSYNLKTIDVSEFDNGTYLLKITSGYNSNSKLFLKK